MILIGLLARILEDLPPNFVFSLAPLLYLGNIVSRSSSEAKYHSLASTTCELQCLTPLLNYLLVSHITPALLYCDSQSPCHIASNSSFHEHTKHIDIDCHIVREKLQAKLFHRLPISSSLQVADILTKPLEPDAFQPLLSKLGVLPIHSPT